MDSGFDRILELVKEQFGPKVYWVVLALAVAAFICGCLGVIGGFIYGLWNIGLGAYALFEHGPINKEKILVAVLTGILSGGLSLILMQGVWHFWVKPKIRRVEENIDEIRKIAASTRSRLSDVQEIHAETIEIAASTDKLLHEMREELNVSREVPEP